MNTDTSILNSYVDASQIAPEYKEAVAGLLSIKAVNVHLTILLTQRRLLQEHKWQFL